MQALGPTAGKLLSRHERATCLFGGLQAFNSQLTTETLCCRRRARHCAGHYVSPVGEAETGKTYSVSVNPPSMRKCRQHGSCFKADAWAVGLFGIITDHQNSISCISKLGYDSTVDPRYFVRFGRWGRGPNAVANCHFFGKCGWQNGTSIAASRHRTQSGLLFSWTSPKIKSLLAKSCSSHHLRSRTLCNSQENHGCRLTG